jgi:hypothetical protein
MSLINLVAILFVGWWPPTSLQLGKTVSDLCGRCVRSNASLYSALNVLRSAELKYALLTAVTGEVVTEPGLTI